MNYLKSNKTISISFVCILMLIPLFLPFSDVYSAALSSAQYSTLNDVLDTHLNYFLSTTAVTSYGIPLSAYKIGNRARYGYSNPAEWGYLLQAYIAGAERGKITKADASSRIATTLATVKAIQDNSLQTYNGGLFYPYYKVTDSAGNDVFPDHDANTTIPSIDNAIFYMSLVIIDGWATDNNFASLSTQSRAIYPNMNFLPFIYIESSTGKMYEALGIDAQTKELIGKCDIYANDGGLTTMVAYLSGTADLETYKALTIAQFRSPASWNGITVQEADWFNPMFAWGVRPIAGIPIVGTPYSIYSMVQSYKGHLAYGNYLGLDYPGFSDAMSQAWVGNYFPPNITGQMTQSIKNITPHAFFIPLNVLSDLDQETLDIIFTKINALMNDSAKYYYGKDSIYPFGFVVTASPYANDLTYAGAYSDGMDIFETLSEAYVALSAFNALQQQDKSKEFSHFIMQAPNMSARIQTAMMYLYSPTISSNSIDSMDVVKITDMSGAGGAINVRAWDKNGSELTASLYALPLSVFNQATTSILGADLEGRFPGGIPVTYGFSVESPKMFITNVNSTIDGTVKVPIIYSNGLSNFVSNSIGSRNTIKVTDMSGTISSGGIPMTITAWDAAGNQIPESTSAVPLMVFSHGTTTIAGSSLPARFPSGTPLTYEFTVASPKLVITNVKNSSDGTLNIPTVFATGVNNFVSNSIGPRNTLYISDFSGMLGASGAAISVKAWDVSGTEIPEFASASQYKIFNYETIKISGSELASRFPSGTPMTYEFTVGSSKFIVTNIKSSSDGNINFPTVYSSGLNNYATNYVSDQNTIRISDMSGTVPSDGANISIVARDVDGNQIAQSGTAPALKLYNFGTTTIESGDLRDRFPVGIPVSYEFSIGSTSAVVTNLTKSMDGTINIPSVFTIGPYGGI